MEFITEEEFKGMTCEKANQVLNRVCSVAAENALRALPLVIENILAQGTVLKKSSEEFYKAHPEFQSHKDVVARVIEDLDHKNPGKAYSELLTEAVPEIRKKIDTLSEFSMNKTKPNVEDLDTKINGEL